MNKKLKIITTKILTDKYKYYRIDKIEGKFKKELPKYYLETENDEPMVYCELIGKELNIVGLLCNHQDNIIRCNLSTLISNQVKRNRVNNIVLYEGQFVEEDYFNTLIKYLKLCSERLSKIMDIIDISSWKGKQEFIF